MNFSHTQTARLEIAADTAVATVLTGCSSPPPKGEVDTVAELVLNGTPAIAAVWKPILAGLGMTVTFDSVFCHGSPYVTFSDTRPSQVCELGDLLLVIDYSNGKSWTRQAALVQAKMDSAGRINVAGRGALDQLALYQKWPVFTFNSKVYDRRGRGFMTAITGASPTDAGRYGGIDLTVKSERWHQIDPTAVPPFVTASGTELGSFLARLADGQAGYGAAATHLSGMPPGTADDWSFTVAELLHITSRLSHAALTRAGGAGTVRGQSHTIKMATAHPMIDWIISELSYPPPGEGKPEGEGGRPRSNGISYIHGRIEPAP
ncbi:hypothetical protein A6U97_27575 [Agrobacterium tumefaciens]|uniref:hypothetical protein n=1 Tax=Agrobacterium tumefaciens TaxID=358 RepID=UPI00080F7EBF|nr:hypothetical protein A6U97_27575 [Agrobacterium tumefaciens]